MKWQTEIDPDAPVTLVEKLALAALVAFPFAFAKFIDAFLPAVAGR